MPSMIKMPIAILIAVVTLLGGFYGGFRIGQSRPTTAFAQNGGTATNGGRNGGNFAAFACPSPGASPAASGNAGRAGRRGASGTVTDLGGSSLTIHDQACNTDEKVTFDSSVIVRKTVDGKTADLQENQTVTVQGTRQADGSIKANVITIVPAGQGGFFGGNGGRGAGATNGG